MTRYCEPRHMALKPEEYDPRPATRWGQLLLGLIAGSWAVLAIFLVGISAGLSAVLQ